MKKLTDEEKEFKGTLKKSRVTVSKTEPLKRLPKPHFKLTDEAYVFFETTARMLMTTGAVTALDVHALTYYAFYVSVFTKAIENSNGNYVQTFQGGATNITGNYSLIKDAQKQIQYYLKVLGLTIKDRGTIIAFAEPEKEDENNPLDAIAEMLNEDE